MLRRILSVTALLCALSLLAPHTALARTNTRDKPVVMIHGYNAFNGGTDCSLFDPLRGELVDIGHTGPAGSAAFWYPVKYHSADQTSCTYDIHGYRGKRDGTSLTTTEGHHTHYGTAPTSYHSGCRHEAVNGYTMGHTTETCMEHYGYHFAWFLYRKFSARGVTVDIVAHSMGGLISRYALGRVEQRHADFPPYLLVEDVVTMGTPHGGAWASNFCWDPTCIASRSGSTFLSRLETYPYFRHPDPKSGQATDWTVMGAWDDGVVEESSAVAMTLADHQMQYLDSADYDHDGYFKNTTDELTADANYRNVGTSNWTTSYSTRHGARWVAHSIYAGSR